MLSFEAFILRTNSLVIKQPSSVLTASLKPINENIALTIPPHVNLLDFYKTYGQRMLGNSNLKIISREEWGADNRYADPEFAKEICKKIYCYPEEYSPIDNFSQEEYLKAKELSINYKENFQNFDDFFRQKLQKENGVIYEYLPIEELMIHHTAGKFTTSLEESKNELQRIYLLHSVQRKWRDIGYHYLIDGAGRIYEGILGGKYSIGAHTYWHNNGTIGIALMGDFRPGHDTLTEPMKESLIKLIQYIIQEYHWDTTSQTFYLKKPDLSGREWSTLLIKGHQELDIRDIKTECPGIDSEELRQIIYPAIFGTTP
jgi:hypothetical protein